MKSISAIYFGNSSVIFIALAADVCVNLCHLIKNGKIVRKQEPQWSKFWFWLGISEGGPSDSASIFFKMANAEGSFFYKDDFDVVITINEC